MSVNAVSAVSNSYSAMAASNSVSSSSITTSNAMDANQFMQLLMAQLTHQDPLEPMNNTEMLTQFSQLNSLQELRDIRTTLEAVSVSNQTTYLASLIGKTVKASRSDGKTIEGVVTGVETSKDKPQLLIGDERVDLSNVQEIQGDVS